MRKRSRHTPQVSGKRVLNTYSRFVHYFAYAQIAQNWQDWTFRTISHRAAQALVADGEAVTVYRKKDGIVQLVGYQALRPTACERPSPATLTCATIHAVSNAVCARGHQPRLSRREREEIEKYLVWALIGDDKAVTVRPRISDDERRRAEKLLGMSGRGAKVTALRTKATPAARRLPAAA